MINLFASILVLLTGLYLVGLAAVSLLAPGRASHFLLGLAGSAPAHYLELLLRFVAGGAIVLYAPHMLFSDFFVLFGWTIVITTIALLAVPWQWHQRFARQAVPHAVRNLGLVGIASLAFGGFVLVAVVLGSP